MPPQLPLLEPPLSQLPELDPPESQLPLLEPLLFQLPEFEPLSELLPLFPHPLHQPESLLLESLELSPGSATDPPEGRMLKKQPTTKKTRLRINQMRAF